MNEKLKVLIATSAGHFSNDWAAYIIPMILPVLILSYDLSISEGAVIATTYALMTAFFALYIGKLIDRGYNIGILISTGLAFIGISFVMIAIFLMFIHGISLFVLLVISVAIGGTGASFYHPLGASLIQRTFEKRKVGSALGINGSMGSLGRAVAPVLFVTISVFIIFPYAVMLNGVIPAIAIAIILSLVCNKKMFKDKDNVGATENIKKGMNIKTKDKESSIIFIVLVITALRSVTTSGFATFIPTYLVKSRNITYGFTLSILIFGMLGAAIIGQPVFGKLMDAFDYRKIFALNTLGIVITMLVFTLTYNIYVIFISLFFYGFFTFAAFPILFGIIPNISDSSRSRGSSNSLLWFGISIGGSVGPLALALLDNKLVLKNMTNSFIALALITAVSFILILIYWNKFPAINK
ncbi:MAG: MFS transporter [Candidatus Thermoplasmatota archaeon]|nr:MFS transporter [Candidatus Thermoplasmatota archaeon]MCL5963675.1 MFS transporter [Candidatus Thermoplasmatota archaeon]